MCMLSLCIKFNLVWDFTVGGDVKSKMLEKNIFCTEDKIIHAVKSHTFGHHRFCIKNVLKIIYYLK